MKVPSRRTLLKAGVFGVGTAALAGCDRITEDPTLKNGLDSAEVLTMHVQRLAEQESLAKEYTEAQLSPNFRVNGTFQPNSEAYAALQRTDFADWHLRIDGLVSNPMALTLPQLRAFPSRSQITRHDCVEGWSGIAKWTGVPLGLVLRSTGLKSNARYAVLYCADELEQTLDGSGRYYESIDLIDAFHPQTILAYQMNDQPLSVGHGAPLRLRVERQLGYKQAKYIMRMELVDSFKNIARGKGGFWEDRGYEWYAGI
jgi:DMSO/TMAO reductase YedYZ molybdopterin-dependent catalytic subunit